MLRVRADGPKHPDWGGGTKLNLRQVVVGELFIYSFTYLSGVLSHCSSDYLE